jgi:threonine synthase
MNVTALRCVTCGRRYAEGEVPYTCLACGIEGILDIEYDYDHVRWQPSEERSIWRYLPLLPVRGDQGLPTLQVGMTPVYDYPRLAERVGVASLLIKDDGRLPTGSFKDRASAVGTVKARELGFSIVACSSTGNAASSLAGFAANQGLSAVIFVPAHAPEAKVAQLRAFGARVLLVEGSYDQAYYLCQEAVAEFGWYNRNCAVNPYLVEGKKTCGLEIGEQLAALPPDVVAVAVGDGCTVAGIWKGMVEMNRLGVLPRLPRLLGVQAVGAAPLAAAFEAGANAITKVKAQTVADSIAVGEPRNWRKALTAVRESGGTLLAVSDEEILEAARDVAAWTGIFAEPTGAAALAGIRRALERGLIDPKERVLHVVTGNGLKDVKGASSKAPPARRIGVSLDDVRKAWAS